LAQQQQQSGGAAVGAGANLPAAGGRGAGTLDLAAISDSPQFRQLRELVQQNPEMIQPIIQQLAASNPALAQLVLQQPEALFDLLGVSPDALEGLEEGEGESGLRTVSVTQDEMAAIQRVSLHYPFSSYLTYLDSWRLLDSHVKPLPKPTSHAIRTKN